MFIADLLSTELIKIPLASTEKSQLLKEMVQILVEQGKVSHFDEVVEALEAREALCSTGLDRGIAIPHAKTFEVKELTLALGISPEGLDFDSLDGNLSHLFFLILTPPDQPGQHVEALSEIAKVTQSSDFVQSLLSAGSSERVLQLIRA